MYYRKNEDGSVLDFSTESYCKECLYTDKAITTAWDGKLYLEDEVPERPDPTPEEIQKRLTDAVQAYLDKKARELNYDSCLSACSYVDTGVAKFDCEGASFRKWRSQVWAKGYEILAEVQAGELPVPTEEELIAMMPELVIDYEDATA